MSKRLYILNLEDNLNDFELNRETLAAAGLDFEMTRVETLEGFTAALDNPAINIILADYTLPAFDGLTALAIASQARPEIPFIFVTGSMGEEPAIEAMKQGATDYVLKEKLTRLPVAVSRALQEREDRRARLEAEEKLRREQAILQVVFDSTDVMLVHLDRDFNFLTVNEAYAASCRMKPAEMIGKNHFDLYPNEENEAIFRQVRDTGKAVFLKDKPFLFPDQPERGVTFWDWSLVPVQDGAGLTQGLVFSLRETTTFKKVELALRESEERFRTLAHLAPVGIYLTDQDGCCIFANQRWCEMAGMSPDEALGDGWKSGLHPDDCDAVFSGWQLMVASKGYWGREYRFRTRGGKVTWVYGLAAPQCNAQGEIVGYIGINVDISAAKQAEEERHQLENQLAQAQKMEVIGRLAGGIAHDFNNMLAVILGYTEILKDEGPNALDKTALEIIEEAATRAKNVTRQLLAFSRKAMISPRPVDINTIITESKKMLSHLIGEDILTTMHLAVGLGKVFIDPAQVDQIILNLAVNARDAMPNGGKLEIATKRVLLDEAFCMKIQDVHPGPYLMLTVQDSGCGMDHETLSHIFEPFYTTKGVGKGTGLGLATVYGIVKQNNGHIDVESEPGQGALFKLYFPIIEESGEQEKPLTDNTAFPTGTGSILLVEDDDMIRNLLSIVLEQLGYRVFSATTAEEAVQTFGREKSHIDLLVTDIILPRMNGNELSKQLRNKKPGLKVLFISGYTSDIIASKGVLEGGVDFLQKPFSKIDVARKIKEIMGLSVAAGLQPFPVLEEARMDFI